MTTCFTPTPACAGTPPPSGGESLASLRILFLQMGGPLSSVDAAWLRMEDPTNLMMVTGILVFEEALDHRRVRSLLEKRLLTFDRFRQRVVEAPFGIGAPRS